VTCRCRLQAKLLRFLQERVIERVGGRQEIPVDVRIVCATHQDLQAADQAEGRFREDLYYRLAEIVVDIPPMRDRVGDAALLAHAFVKRFASEQAAQLADAVGRRRARHRAAHLAGQHPRVGETASSVPASWPTGSRSRPTDRSFDLRTVRDEAERKAVIAALARVDGNVLRAAELLGVSRPTLYDLMHRLGLK
jgi:two-component system NtrC family response regulator